MLCQNCSVVTQMQFLENLFRFVSFENCIILGKHLLTMLRWGCAIGTPSFFFMALILYLVYIFVVLH